MKFIKSIVALAGLSILASCSAINTANNATVVKDCTGIYLRMDNKDYQVCNTDIIKNYKQGSKVTAAFKKIEKCTGLDGSVSCMMYHESAGVIHISSIK